MAKDRDVYCYQFTSNQILIPESQIVFILTHFSFTGKDFFGHYSLLVLKSSSNFSRNLRNCIFSIRNLVRFLKEFACVSFL